MLKRACVILLLSVAVLSGSGCALPTHINTQMQSWVGHNSSELVRAWGPPTTTQDIGGGQRALTWDLGQGAYRSFVVDTTGTVQSFSWRGLF